MRIKMNSKYYTIPSTEVRKALIKFLRECDDAGLTAMDARDYLGLEDPDLHDAMLEYQISFGDCWKAMRVQKVDEESKTAG